MDDITAVIPIRKGSTRVLGKNLRPFAFAERVSEADSLLSWKIKQLSQVLPAERILVSSDWAEALEVASAHGCITHERAAWLCTEDAPFDEVIGAVATEVNTEHMMWSPVTSPFAGAKTIHRFLDAYLSGDPASRERGYALTSDLREYFFMSGKPLNFPIGKGHVRTQEIVPITKCSWALTARPTETVRALKYMFSENPITVDADFIATFDINDEIEFQAAQALIPLFLQLEKGE